MEPRETPAAAVPCPVDHPWQQHHWQHRHPKMPAWWASRVSLLFQVKSDGSAAANAALPAALRGPRALASPRHAHPTAPRSRRRPQTRGRITQPTSPAPSPASGFSGRTRTRQGRCASLRDGLRQPLTRTSPTQRSLDQGTGQLWEVRHDRICQW